MPQTVDNVIVASIWKHLWSYNLMVLYNLFIIIIIIFFTPDSKDLQG